MSLSQIIVGSIAVLIGADASGLKDGVAKSEKELKGLERTTASIVHRMKAAFLALAGPTAIGLLVKASMDTIDAQGKLARQIGATVASVQTLTRVAQLAGVSYGELSGNLHKMNQRLGQAMRDGFSPAADALRQLGLRADTLSKMNIDERFATIADRVKTLGLNGQQTTDILSRLGLRGQNIANIFENGGQAIRATKDELKGFGVIVDDIDAESISRTNDAWTVFALTMQGIGNQLAVHLTPLLQLIADKFRDVANESGGWGARVQEAIRSVVVGFGVIPAMVHNVRAVWDGLMDFMIGSLNAFGAAWNATIGRVTFSIPQIENKYGELAKTLGTAPTAEDWGAWWDKMVADSREKSKQMMEDRKNLNKGDGSGIDWNSSRENRRYEGRLTALRQSLATEDQLLVLQREKQLKDLAEFEQRRIVSAQEAANMRLQIEAQHAKAMDELLQTKFEETFLTEQELMARKHEQQLADLAAFEANKTITEEQANELRRSLLQRHEEQMHAIRAAGWSRAASIIDSAMADITSIMGSEGGKQFAIVKAISMATALMKGYEAVVSAYAAGSRLGGPALGAVFAGIAAAATAAQIAKIAGVGANSKGTPTAAGTGGGGGAARAASGGRAGGGGRGNPGDRSIYISGINKDEMFSGDSVRKLVDKLVEFQKDGGKVVYAKP